MLEESLQKSVCYLSCARLDNIQDWINERQRELWEKIKDEHRKKNEKEDMDIRQRQEWKQALIGQQLLELQVRWIVNAELISLGEA